MKITSSILIAVAVLSFIFILSTFQPVASPPVSSDFFLTYLLFHLKSILDNGGYFLVIFLGLAFVVFRTLANDNFTKKTLTTIFNSAALTFLSIFVSYIILFTVAFAELNIMSILININPKTVGLETEHAAIKKRLEGLKTAPQILASEKDRHKMLVAVAVASSGKNNVFSSNVLASVPSFLVIPIREPKSSILMLDNMLIIASVNREELEKIAPTIAALFISSYFYDRPIKTALELSVVDVKDYVSFREKGIDARMDIVDEDRIKNDEDIASISARIEEIQGEIAANEGFLDNAPAQRNEDFKECIKENETEFCQEQRSQFDDTIKAARDELSELTIELEDNEKLLEEKELFREVYSQQEEIVDGRRGYLSREHGIFEPPDEIVIPLDNDSARTITDFFTIFIHEYLHYASFVAEETTLQSSFFEEGLTEYFARRILSSRLEAATNLGYPLQIKIIERINDLVHENELEDIYFTKDQALLEETLDKVFGEGFYRSNRTYFEALQYTSDQDQLLKIANLIMEKIGGDKLTKEDLVSSFAK